MSEVVFDGHWKLDGRVHAISGQIDDTTVRGSVDGRPVAIGLRSTSSDIFLGGVRTRIVVALHGGKILLSIGGRYFECEPVEAARASATTETCEPYAVSPMSGLVTKVHVAKGDRVAKGAPLFAVEAMKMEYVVKADRAVVIAEVKVTAGTRVAINEPGVTFEAGGTL